MRLFDVDKKPVGSVGGSFHEDECIKKSDFVECVECGGLISNQKAKSIYCILRIGWTNDTFKLAQLNLHNACPELHYCPAHIKPYDLEIHYGRGDDTKYYKLVEVDEFGKITK